MPILFSQAARGATGEPAAFAPGRCDSPGCNPDPGATAHAGVRCASSHFTCLGCLAKQARDPLAARKARWYEIACGRCGASLDPVALSHLIVAPQRYYEDADLGDVAEAGGRLRDVKPGTLQYAFAEMVFFGPRAAGQTNSMRAWKDAAVVTRVQKVTFGLLWDKYKGYRDAVAVELGGGQVGSEGANEIWVKHGTSTLDPAVIIDPKRAGFDARFSCAGMLGKALYLAESSAYSDSYAYDATDAAGSRAVKKMYLVRLAAGRVFDIAETPLPPGAAGAQEPWLSGNYKQRRGEITIPPFGFHTVRDDVGGPLKAYTVYGDEAKRAFPAYLVTYEI